MRIFFLIKFFIILSYFVRSL